MGTTGLKREVRGWLTPGLPVIAAVCLTAVVAFGQSTTWKGGSGNWNDSTKWTSGFPNASTSALIDGGNAVASPVTLNIGAQVLNLTVDSDDSLNFNDNTNLTVNGSSISNAGSITLNSSNNATDLILAGNNTVTLSGVGKLALGNNGANRVYSAGGGGKLINQETIQGGGQLGVARTAITNSGTINANVSTALIVSPSSTGVTNTGIMEASSGGTLDLQGGYANAGGTIQALAGSTVKLDGAAITGGTLTTSGGGLMESINSATLNGVTISTGSTYTEPDNTNTTLVGTITNNGTIQLNSSNNPTDLRISGAVTLTGTGTVTMGNNGANRIYAPNGTDKLTNKQTIQGGGQLGVGLLTLANQGTINANIATALVIQPGSGGATNSGGIMEATNGATLQLNGFSGGAFNNTNGTIQALNAATPSTVVLLNGATVTGGTLTTTGNGIIESGNSAALSGVTISAGSTYVELDNTNTTLQGTITNNGTVQLNSSNNPTDLILAGSTTVTITGGGKLILGNNGNNRIYSALGGGTLVNQETIQGGGQLGVARTTITNSATINANVPTALLVSPSGGGVTNTGTIEASSGGTLDLQGSYANTGGTIQALPGSTVKLDGAAITGGTLTASGGGLMESINSATLNGVTISTGSTYTEPDNTNTTLVGTITNNGTIQLNSSNNPTDLKISGPVTLTGTGTVTMGNNGANRIYAPNGTDKLTNKQTIQGGGQLGVGLLTLANQGTINANIATALIIQPGSGGATNSGGIMQATNGATLQLNGGAFNNTSGTIRALNAATPSTVVLLNGATVTGGTLTTTGNGIIESGNSATLKAVTVSAGSIYVEPDNTNTTLQGTITNNGTIQLNSSNNPTDLKISGPVTLTGTGRVTMGNNGANRIYAPNGTDTLTNNETIQGAGQIGAGSMGLVNNGTILANQPTALLLQPSGSGFTNKGTLNVSSGDLMHVSNASGGPFTNFSGSTLTGGTYNVTGTLEIDQLGSAGGEIVTNAANIILNGTTSSFIDAAGKNALSNLNTTATGSGFTITGGRNFTTVGKFTNNGTLTIGSGSTFKVPTGFSLTNFSGTTLTGGTYNVTGTLQFGAVGTSLKTNAANINLTGSTAKMIDSAGGNILTAFATNNAGRTFGISGGYNFTTAGNFTNNGTLTVGSGSTFVVKSGSNLTNFSGTTLTGGTYNVTGTLQFGAAGSSLKTNAANINLTGSTTKMIDSAGGNILTTFATNNAGSTFGISGGYNFTTAGNFTNNGTLTVGSSNSKFNVNGNLTNFNSTTNTLTGGTYNLTGILQFNGANIVTNAANITLSGTTSQIINQSSANGLANFATNAATGKFTVAGGRVFTTSGAFTNNGGLTLTGSGSKFTTGGNFTNAGLFTIGSSTVFAVGGSGTFTQTAGTTTDDGTLTLPSLGTLSLNGGSLFGTGSITGTVKSSGAVSPGDSIAATGILKDTGAYTQNSTGVLNIAIAGTTAGTQYDQLNPTTASLGGTLNISRPTSFVPSIGSTFKIMNFISESGTFATVNGLSINSTEHFTITYEAKDVLLKVVAGMAPSLARSNASRSVGLIYRGGEPGRLGFGLYGRGGLSNFPRLNPRVFTMADLSSPLVSERLFESQVQSGAAMATTRTRSMVDFSSSSRFTQAAGMGAMESGRVGFKLSGRGSLNNFPHLNPRVAMAAFTSPMVSAPLFGSRVQSGASMGTTRSRSMVDFTRNSRPAVPSPMGLGTRATLSGWSMARLGTLQTSPSGYLGVGVISAAKLASMDSVGRRNTLSRIAAFGPARNLPAGMAPHSFITTGANVATHNRINPATAAVLRNGRAPRMMAPKSVEYHLDVLSFVGMGPRQALRGLWRQPGNPNTASVGYFTFSGIR